MARALLALLLLPLLSGCLVETPEEAQADGSGATSSDPAFSREAVRVLGRLYLHNDGTRQWMDARSGDDLPLPGVTATSQGNTFTFPYEPTLSEDVMTAGLAQFTLATSNTVAVTGEAPAFVATLVVDGTASGSVAGQGSGNLVLIPIPALIRAGSSLTLEICFCGAATDLSLVVFEPAQSVLDIPGPSTTECGPDALATGKADVQPNGSQWVARRTDVGTGPAPQAYQTLGVTTHNGGIDVQRGGSDSYSLEANLQAYGATADEARARLDAMCINVDRSSDNADLTAMLVATDGLSQPWNNRGASIALSVPTASAANVQLDASNGGIDLSGVQIGTLGLDTSNGDVTVHADVQDAVIDSSNGGLDLQGGFGDLEATSSNGGITLDLRPLGQGSLTWFLDTSNAEIEGTVATGTSIGYDARAATSNGDATLDLSGAEPVGEQDDDEKHVRTQGYDSRETRVELTLDSSNGGISVSG